MATTSLRTYVARSGAAADTTAPVALVAATAKVVLSILAPATTPVSVHRWVVSFDSVTAAHVPAVVELLITSTLGSGGTANTPNQVTGHSNSPSVTAHYNVTTPPTLVRIVSVAYVPVNNGMFVEWFPLGFEPQADSSQGFCIRVTSPAACNCLPSLYFSE